MDRRNFLSTSLPASALSLASLAAAAPQSPAAEYYELRRYQLANGPGTKLTDQYFAGALIPALNRLGIGHRRDSERRAIAARPGSRWAGGLNYFQRTFSRGS